MSNKTNRNSMMKAQDKVDQEFWASVGEYNDNKENFYKKWQNYVSLSKQNTDWFHERLGWKDPEEKLSSEARDKKIRTASKELSEARKEILKRATDFPPHFKDELEKLKEEHPKFWKLIETLDYSSPKNFRDSIEKIIPDKDIREMLRKLPFCSPAWHFLCLPKDIYQKLNKESRQAKVERLRNAPTISLGKVRSFISDVYKHRKTREWTDLLIALYFCSGRRKCEIVLADILKGDEGHISLVTAKQKQDREKSKAEDFPVLFASVEQFFEMHELLIQRLQPVIRKASKSAPDEWERLKSQFDAATLDEYTRKVRDEFHLNFAVKRPKEGLVKQAVAIHNAARSVYAQFAYHSLQQHPRYEGKSLIGIANEVLGHGDQSLDATLSYLDVILRFDDGQAVAGKGEPVLNDSLPDVSAFDKLTNLPGLKAFLGSSDAFTGPSERLSLGASIRASSPNKRALTRKSEPLTNAQETNRSKPVTEEAPSRTRPRSEKHKKTLQRRLSEKDKSFIESIHTTEILNDLLVSVSRKDKGVMDLYQSIITELKHEPTQNELLKIARKKDVQRLVELLAKHKIYLRLENAMSIPDGT